MACIVSFKRVIEKKKRTWLTREMIWQYGDIASHTTWPYMAITILASYVCKGLEVLKYRAMSRAPNITFDWEYFEIQDQEVESFIRVMIQ